MHMRARAREVCEKKHGVAAQRNTRLKRLQGWKQPETNNWKLHICCQMCGFILFSLLTLGDIMRF